MGQPVGDAQTVDLERRRFPVKEGRKHRISQTPVGRKRDGAPVDRHIGPVGAEEQFNLVRVRADLHPPHGLTRRPCRRAGQPGLAGARRVAAMHIGCDRGETVAQVPFGRRGRVAVRIFLGNEVCRQPALGEAGVRQD